MRAEIEQLVGQAASRGHDALVVGVLAEGEPTFRAWRRGGPADERALFEIGSVTKPFTGVLLADLSLRGEVRMEDPVSKYLPPAHTPRWSGREPTLEELATHRASLPNAPSGLGRKELAFALGLRSSDPWTDLDARAYRELVHATAARRPPGRRFRYSSLGFGLLGDALAAAAGVPYGQLLRDRIAGPLGLRDTGTSVASGTQLRLLDGHSRRGHPRPPLRDQMPAAGAIRATAQDLLRFLACSLGPPETPPGPALRRATEWRAPVSRRLGVGLGWLILRRRGTSEVIWHSGGTWGFRSFAAMVPDRRVAVVVLANTARPVVRLGFKLIDRMTPVVASPVLTGIDPRSGTGASS
jgi:D-alanyl-D-alanine-carboxypeptidase/D-alanyl-D-alanine-endopeptidase